MPSHNDKIGIGSESVHHQLLPLAKAGLRCNTQSPSAAEARCIVDPGTKMSLDTLITAIEIDMGATREGQRGRTLEKSTPPIPRMKINASTVREECTSSCSGSSYSCSDSCSSSSDSDEEAATVSTAIEVKPKPDTNNASDKYVCQHCNRTFLWADAFMTHLATHTSDKPHVCTICDRCFTNAASLARHMKDHTANDVQYPNWASAPVSELSKHLKTSQERDDEESESSGDDARKKSDSDEEWTTGKHRKRKTRSSDKTCVTDEAKLVCEYCQMKFAYKCGLERHLRTHSKKRPYKCQSCESSFKTSHQLVQHQLVHTEEKPFQCPTCQNYFKTANQLKSHQVMHTGERPFVCGVCQSSFPRKHTLTKHMRIHTNEKPYKCQECGKLFSYSDRLKEHMISHNPQEQNTIVCETCGKRFTHKRNLKVHERIHIGFRKYKCELCPKTFLQASGRSRHMKTHTGDKPHQCDICGIRFGYPSEVAEHVKKIHNGEKDHKCDTCYKSFHSVRDLRRHFRTHTGEKPYPCNVCGKSFTQAYTLKTHSLIHTGERSRKTKSKKKSSNNPSQPSPNADQEPVTPHYSTTSSVKPEQLEYQTMEYSDQYQYHATHQDYAPQTEKIYCRNYAELYETSHMPPSGSAIPLVYGDTSIRYGTTRFQEGKLPPVSELSRLPRQEIPRYEPLPNAPYKPHIHADPITPELGGDTQYGVSTDENAYIRQSDPMTYQQRISGLEAYCQAGVYEGHYEQSEYADNPYAGHEPATPYDTGAVYEEHRLDQNGGEGDPIYSTEQDYKIYKVEEVGEVQRYKCEGCCLSFETSSELLDHLKAHIDAELAGITQNASI